jgi:hypothetical protein
MGRSRRAQPDRRSRQQFGSVMSLCCPTLLTLEFPLLQTTLLQRVAET